MKIIGLFEILLWLAFFSLAGCKNQLSWDQNLLVTKNSDAVILSWKAPPEDTSGTAMSASDIGGYKIYYGTSQGQLIEMIDAGKVLTYSIPRSYFATKTTYYFSVTAYGISGLESEKSNIVSKYVE